MVDAKRLLADLKKLHKTLVADLRGQHGASAQRDAVQEEWRAAFDTKRTADTFETFWTASVDQAAVHWILGVVFLRFLEDNRLLDRPFLSGPGERLELAAERQRAYFRVRPLDIDTDYLLDSFAEAARLPGLAGLYDPAHNPLFRLPVSGDGAIALLDFLRARMPETGALLHDFTDPDWNTRFLGDLYQALLAAGETRLAAAPDFRFSLAVGDSLLHGRHFGRQRDFAHELDGGFQRRLRHHYATEDTVALDAILGRQYHAVVGNPPYITPKDAAMRDAYREIFVSCHMKYGLGAPFTERFFDLAQTDNAEQAPGFIGLIVANTFIKREFGEKVLPLLDLTHVIDTSSAYIPGHTIPTVVLFGRNRRPLAWISQT